MTPSWFDGMFAIETPESRLDRLILSGNFTLTDTGLAMWCHVCKDHVPAPWPRDLTHEAITDIARRYLDHLNDACVVRQKFLDEEGAA